MDVNSNGDVNNRGVHVVVSSSIVCSYAINGSFVEFIGMNDGTLYCNLIHDDSDCMDDTPNNTHSDDNELVHDEYNDVIMENMENIENIENNISNNIGNNDVNSININVGFSIQHIFIVSPSTTSTQSTQSTIIGLLGPSPKLNIAYFKYIHTSTTLTTSTTSTSTSPSITLIKENTLSTLLSANISTNTSTNTSTTTTTTNTNTTNTNNTFKMCSNLATTAGNYIILPLQDSRLAAVSLNQAEEIQGERKGGREGEGERTN